MDWKNKEEALRKAIEMEDQGKRFFYR